MIIILGGTKGGTGKSTIVTNLAAIDVNQGHDALLVDSDRQGSASYWAAVREETGLLRVPTIQKFGQLSLTNELRALTKKYENIFVDAGGFDSEELRAAMLAGNQLLIPVRPAQFDVWTLPRIIKIFEESQLYNPHLQARFVINGAHTHPHVKEADENRELLHDLDQIRLCQSVIHARRAFVKAPALGMAVTELRGKEADAKASDEMMNLYRELNHNG